MHSLSPEKFLSALELGGIPMPSVAVTRLDKPYGWGGGNNLYLIGRPELVDPAKGTEVFSADAWTGTVPQLYYRKKWDVKGLRKDMLDKLRPYGLDGESGLHDEFLWHSQMYGYVPDSAVNTENRALKWYWALTEGGFKKKPAMTTSDADKQYPFLKDKEFAFNVLTNDIAAVPFVSDAVADVRSVVLNEYLWSSSQVRMSIPFSDIFVEGKREWKNIQKDASWDKHVTALCGLARAIGASGGWVQNGSNVAVGSAAELALAAAALSNTVRFAKDVIKKVED